VWSFVAQMGMMATVEEFEMLPVEHQRHIRNFDWDLYQILMFENNNKV
jgi:hypothetical protein